MARQSALGRAIRYVSDAWRYGLASKAEGKPSFRRVLTALARVGTGGIASGDIEAMARLATVNSWVYSDIKLISDRVSGEDELFSVERYTGKKKKGQLKASEPIEDHPLLDLLPNPNPLISQSFLMRYTCWWMCLLGNAFWYMVPEKAQGQGPISEIWPLPALLVTPVPESLRESTLTGLPIIDYSYSIGGDQKRLLGENVVHFRTANPFDYWVGLSPLTALQMPLRTDYSQSYWLDTFFGEDNAIPSAIISVPADLDDDDFDVVRDDLKQQFGGGRRTAVTRAGDISVELLQHTIAELRVLDGRQFNQKEIDRVFGIPEGLISGGLSGDSRMAAEITFARNAIQPLVNLLISEFSIKVIPFYSKLRGSSEKAEQRTGDLHLVPANVVPQDRALELSEYTGYKSELTINEARQLQDKDALKLSAEFVTLQPLLDEIPAVLVPLVGMTVVDKWKGEYAPPQGMGADFGYGAAGAENDFEAWFGNLESQVDGIVSGEPPPDQGAQQGPALGGKQPTPSSGEAGQRISGQPTQDQTMRELSKSFVPLTPDELEAVALAYESVRGNGYH